MKKLLNLLTAAVLFTSSISSMTAFTTKIKQNVKLKNNIQNIKNNTLKNNTLKNKTLGNLVSNQEQANAIMSTLKNKLVTIISDTKRRTYTYQYKNEIQWALNEIVPQTDTSYNFYFANGDGNKILSFLSFREIYIGVEVDGVKCDIAHQSNIKVLLSHTSIDDTLNNLIAKLNNTHLTVNRVINKYRYKDYENTIKQDLYKIVNPKKIPYTIGLAEDTDYNNKFLSDQYKWFNMKVTIDGDLSNQFTIYIKASGLTDEQIADKVANDRPSQLSLLMMPKPFTPVSAYISEIKDAWIKHSPDIKNIDFKLFCMDKYKNNIMTDKFQTIGFFIQVGQYHSQNVYVNVKYYTDFTRTKEAIEAAPAVIQQSLWNDANHAQSVVHQHISRPSLWNNGRYSINYYWASYNIYVNWYNIHWACQTEGNFFVNVFKHFINYSGRSIAQSVAPASWEKDRKPCPEDLSPTYYKTEKISPFDDNALKTYFDIGAITCSRYWENNFYADLPDVLKDAQSNRSVHDVRNQIYYDAAHAPQGSHGIKFQISFALNDDHGAKAGIFSQAFLGNNNVNIVNDTDLPTFW